MFTPDPHGDVFFFFLFICIETIFSSVSSINRTNFFPTSRLNKLHDSRWFVIVTMGT